MIHPIGKKIALIESFRMVLDESKKAIAECYRFRSETKPSGFRFGLKPKPLNESTVPNDM